MKKFGDLTKEEKMTLVESWIDGEDIEHFHPDGGWYLVKCPSWHNDNAYRVAKKKPQIDWSHVSPEYKWLATDENGSHWLYTGKPCLHPVEWRGAGASCPRALASFKKGNCDWKESLIGRDKK